MDASKIQCGCVSLLHDDPREKHGLALSDVGSNSLREGPLSSENTNLVGIFGDMRKGKSTLLNVRNKIFIARPGPSPRAFPII